MPYSQHSRQGPPDEFMQEVMRIHSLVNGAVPKLADQHGILAKTLSEMGASARRLADVTRPSKRNGRDLVVPRASEVAASLAKTIARMEKDLSDVYYDIGILRRENYDR